MFKLPRDTQRHPKDIQRHLKDTQLLIDAEEVYQYSSKSLQKTPKALSKHTQRSLLVAPESPQRHPKHYQSIPKDLCGSYKELVKIFRFTIGGI